MRTACGRGRIRQRCESPGGLATPPGDRAAGRGESKSLRLRPRAERKNQRPFDHVTFFSEPPAWTVRQLVYLRRFPDRLRLVPSPLLGPSSLPLTQAWKLSRGHTRHLPLTDLRQPRATRGGHRHPLPATHECARMRTSEPCPGETPVASAPAAAPETVLPLALADGLAQKCALGTHHPRPTRWFTRPCFVGMTA